MMKHTHLRWQAYHGLDGGEADGHGQDVGDAVVPEGGEVVG